MIYIFLFIFKLNAQSVPQPNFSLSGVLLEKGTKIPLANVNIFLLPHKIKTTTDSDGKYRFDKVPAGETEWVINQTGYYRYSKKTSVTENQSDKTIYLEKKRYSGFETTVIAKSKKRDASQKTLSQENFLTAPGAGKDPVKAVQNLSGVNRQSGANAQIVIQGSDANDTTYLIDGHEIPLVFHFGGLTSVVTPEAVEAVDYLSAGFGPEYGRSIGGIIQLRTRNPMGDRWRGFSYMDNFNMGGLAEGPVSEKTNLLVSARYAYIGPVLQKVAEDREEFNLSVAPTFWDITAISSTRLNASDQLKWTVLASKDTLQFVLKQPVNNDPALRGRFFSQTDFSRLIGTFSRKLDNDRSWEISVAPGHDNITFDLSQRFFRIKTTSLSTRGEYRTGKKFRTYLGFDNDYSFYDLNLRLQRRFSQGGISNPLSSGQEVALEDKGKLHNLGLYVRNEIYLDEGEKWMISPNLRYDSFRSIKRSVLQPRLSLNYFADKSTTYKFASGIYYQPPEPAESSSGFGNPLIGAPLATHYMLGWDKDFRKGTNRGFTLATSAFYKELKELVTDSDRLQIIDGQLVTENYRNSGLGIIKGAELELSYQIKNASAKVAYTLLNSTRRNHATEWHPAEFDQTHSLNILGKYEWDRWILSTRYRFVTGNPETPVESAIFDADSDTYLPVRGKIYSDRRPDFHQLDLRVDRKWVYDTWILSMYLDIQNIFSTKNIESREYSYDYSESQDVMGLPALPSFGLKGEF